jgi:flagellar hook-associated protein 1 FlgK
MADSLLNIGKTAVLANSRLLNTTGNNIANINTPGYVRQRTTFVSEQFGLGVGQGTTERLVSEFTQKQLRRDTTNAAYSSQYLAEANRLDALFSNAANSIATGMNNLFQQIQTANNDPTQLSNRQLVLGTSQSLLDQFRSMSTLIADQEQFLNQQLDSNVSEVNDLISQIATYNNDIVSYGSSSSRPVPLDLLDRRDSAILKLAEYVDIQTVDSNSGEKLVFMASGQALVVERGEFNLLSLRGEPDPNDRIIELTLQSNDKVKLELDAQGVGGKIGALTDYRLQVINPTQRQLGQLSLALADSMNTQNKLGLTLNGTLGQDLFRLPVAQGLSFATNSANARVSVSVEPGQSGKLPPNDFLLEVIDTNNLRLTPLDEMGNPIKSNAKNIPTAGLPDQFDSTSVPDGDLFGLQLQVDAAVAGDKFVLKPLNAAARSMQMATNRAEDVALAGPLRGEFASANLGNGRIDGVKIFATDTPAFTSSSLVNGPYTVTYQGQDVADNNRFVFSITDNTGAVLGEARFDNNNFNNVLSQAVDPLSIPPGQTLKDTKGFDFNITGVPRPGDRFIIAFNENGFNDNRNGLEFSALQNAPLVRRNPESFGVAVNQYSLNQSYATMVGNIGERTRQARTAAEANAAILEQSILWYESLSGVNLDEEAADLVRFQQSYAAAAKILATSQTIFDTLLQAVR